MLQTLLQHKHLKDGCFVIHITQINIALWRWIIAQTRGWKLARVLTFFLHTRCCWAGQADMFYRTKDQNWGALHSVRASKSEWWFMEWQQVKVARDVNNNCEQNWWRTMMSTQTYKYRVQKREHTDATWWRKSARFVNDEPLIAGWLQDKGRWTCTWTNMKQGNIHVGKSVLESAEASQRHLRTTPHESSFQVLRTATSEALDFDTCPGSCLPVRAELSPLSDPAVLSLLDCQVQCSCQPCDVPLKKFSANFPMTVLHTQRVFRWFKGGCEIWELLEKVSEIGASEIKSPIGRVFQKYVYSSFIFKMRINFRSFGLFHVNLGWR